MLILLINISNTLFRFPELLYNLYVHSNNPNFGGPFLDKVKNYLICGGTTL